MSGAFGSVCTLCSKERVVDCDADADKGSAASSRYRQATSYRPGSTWVTVTVEREERQ